MAPAKIDAIVVALSVILVVSCSQAPAPEAIPAEQCAPPVLVPGVPVASTPAALRFSSGARVVMVSFDGVSATEVQALRGTYFGEDGYNRMLREGTSAHRVRPVSPTLTAVTHTSLATGAQPAVTGIVSNTFHLRGTPAAESVSGFETEIQADTIWEAARRAGRTVGVITYPGVDARDARRTADWGLIYTHSLTKAKLVQLTRKDFQEEWLPPGWSGTSTAESFSPKLTARITWETPVEGSRPLDVLLTATDTIDDGAVRYDTLTVRYGKETVRPDANRWFPVWKDVLTDGAIYRYGSWSKVLQFDGDLENVTVYWGGIHRTEGYPESFRKMIETQVGFWPGPPDEGVQNDWEGEGVGVEPETFREQMVRFSDFFTAATLLAMKTMPFDLLLAYQPIVDETEHRYHITDKRQADYSEQNYQSAWRVRIAAYQQFDKAVGRLLEATDPSMALVVTGDHGLGPLDLQVKVNRLLIDWGYAKADGRMLAASTPWGAYATASVAQIYAIDPTRAHEASEIARRLRALRTPDGSPVFERVTLRQPSDNPRAGDIVAYTYPNIAATSSTGEPLFEKTHYYGQHGGLNHHCELHTLFAAWGKGVPKQQIEILDQTKIIRMVSVLLGISPPRQAE